MVEKSVHDHSRNVTFPLNTHFIAMPSNPHEKIVGLDVSVDEILVVNILNSADHLK